MPYIILPNRRPGIPRPSSPWRGGPLRTRFAFLVEAVKLGGRRLWLVLNVLGVVVGVTLVWLLTRLADWDWSWAIAVGSVALLLIILEGAFRVWDGAYKTAIHYMPTWEFLQDRADVLRAELDANLPREQWNAFIGRYISTHRLPAQCDFDLAETAGFPLSLKRDDLARPEGPPEFLAIIVAFEEAAAEWKEFERGAAMPPV